MEGTSGVNEKIAGSQILNTPSRTIVVTMISDMNAKAYPRVNDTWNVPINVLILLYFPTKTDKSTNTGAIAASQTTDKFFRKSRLYSGTGSDRGDTAQYDRRAIPRVENDNFWMESKLILDSAPAISTA